MSSRRCHAASLAALAPIGLVFGLVVTLATGGCGNESTPASETIALLDHQRWVEVAQADDPFWSLRPVDAPTCAPHSFQIEGFTPQTQSIEVDTTACQYLTIGQALPAAINKGDTLELLAWHVRLSADGATVQNPVEGMMGVAVGDHVVWQVKFDIPGAEDSFTQSIVADFSAPVGALLSFHVHNHGSNTYNLMKVDVVR